MTKKLTTNVALRRGTVLAQARGSMDNADVKFFFYITVG
jgi:hypothetical protein